MGKKANGVIGPKFKQRSAKELHKIWVDQLCKLSDWDEYEWEYRLGRRSRGPKYYEKARREFAKFELAIIELLLQFGCSFKENGFLPSGKVKYKIEKRGQLSKFSASAILSVINEDRPVSDAESLMDFEEFIDSRIAKGKGRKIPSFLAEHALAGFELHNRKKEIRGEPNARELMREYFKLDGEFSKWYKNKFEALRKPMEIDIPGRICLNTGSSLTVWTKQFKATMRDNVRYHGKRPTTAQLNSMVSRRKKGILDEAKARLK